MVSVYENKKGFFMFFLFFVLCGFFSLGKRGDSQVSSHQVQFLQDVLPLFAHARTLLQELVTVVHIQLVDLHPQEGAVAAVCLRHFHKFAVSVFVSIRHSGYVAIDFTEIVRQSLHVLHQLNDVAITLVVA